MNREMGLEANHEGAGEAGGETGRCPRCGASLVCGARIGQCWCMARPPLGFDPGYGSCLCADCLAALARQGRPDARAE